MENESWWVWLGFLSSHIAGSFFRLEFRRFLLLLLYLLLFFGQNMQHVAAGEWPYQAQRGSFVFQADFPIDTRQQLVSQLVHMREELARTLHLPPSQERIDIYLFRERGVYEQYMKHYFPTVSPRRAMFIKSNSPGNVFAYVSPQFDVDLRHESTHAMLHAMLPMVPLWLDEGLAEYFELPEEKRAFDNPYLNQVRRSVRWQRPPSLQRLEQLTSIDQMGATEYRQAWSWVHFMLHGPPEARQTLIKFFEDIHKHQPPRQLSRSLQANVPAVEKAFAEHFRRWHR